MRFRRRKYLRRPALGAIVASLVLLGAGCDRAPSANADREPPPIATLVRQGQGPELLQFPAGGIAGMGLATVRSTALPGVLQTTGQITFNDRRVANIVSRVTGRIEELRVSQWDSVRRGQPVLTLYSPDFMTGEAEYLQAKASLSALSRGGAENVQFARSLIEAAERKLELLGIGRDQFATIKQAAPTFVMRAPISGIVVQNQALRGSAVNPGDVLFGVGTIDDVWITGDIYEDDLARVRVGQPLRAVTTAYPNDVFRGTVQRISPAVDPNTHTLQIRCQVQNPGLKLKPQMLAQVSIDVLPSSTVTVPMAALVFETENFFAYVDVGGERFERRKVIIGPWSQPGYARVTEGLAPGDRVVVEATMQVNELWHQAHGESS